MPALRLTRAYLRIWVYENASPVVKRKLVEIVSSNHVLKDGTLRFKYKKPFDLLSRTASKEIWWTIQHPVRTQPISPKRFIFIRQLAPSTPAK